MAKQGVVQWFDPAKDEGFMLNIANGIPTIIKGKDFTAAIKAQIIKDNVFDFDLEDDPDGPNPDSKKVGNLNFVRSDPGLADATLAKFPPKSKKGPNKDDFDPKEPFIATVNFYPIGTDVDKGWQMVTAITNAKNQPLDKVKYRFFGGKIDPGTKNHVVEVKESTDATGESRKSFDVEENIHGHFIVDAGLSIPNIIVPGPETPRSARPAKTGWPKYNNWVLGAYLLIMVTSFFFLLYQAWEWNKKPLLERYKLQQQSVVTATANNNATGGDISNLQLIIFVVGGIVLGIAAYRYLEPIAALVIVGIWILVWVLVIWSMWWLLGYAVIWLPYWSWKVFGVWLLASPIVFFACVYDELKEVAVYAQIQVEQGINWIKHTRKPLAYKVVRRGKDGMTEYYINGKRVSQPASIEDRIKDVGVAQVASLLKFERWQTVLELAQLLLALKRR